MRVDAELIAGILSRALAGERRALEELIRSYQAPVASFVAARVSDRAAVADICQTAFVKMALALPKLRAPETFEPWLYRIAENTCRDFQRRERWRRRLFVRLEPRHEATSPVEVEPPVSSQLAELQMQLASVDPRHRELLALSLERPRSYSELASLTRLSVPAVKSRLFRARAALRILLGRKETKHEH